MKQYLTFSIVATYLCYTYGVSALPLSGPNGENARGLFATYFDNMVNGACPTNSYVTGFTTTALDYMKPVCTTFWGWALGWNTTQSTDFLGTRNNTPLVFKTNADGDPQEKMVITSDGKVGIATSSPLSTLHVSGSLLARGLTDAKNGTWFPWTNSYNYIRGTTYFSWFLVDEQDARFYMNPSETSVFQDIVVSGTISGNSPTEANHFATKAYVDAAVLANNGGGGGGLSVYKSDGVTKVWNYLWLSDWNTTDLCTSVIYSNTAWVPWRLSANDCLTATIADPLIYKNTTCDPAGGYFIEYREGFWNSSWIYKIRDISHSDSKKYDVVRLWDLFTMWDYATLMSDTQPMSAKGMTAVPGDWYNLYSYWDWNTDSCKTKKIHENAAQSWCGGHCTYTIGYPITLQNSNAVCGFWKCLIK